MALSTDIKVYNRESYDLRTEIINEKVDLFNAATNGAIVLRTVGRDANRGSFNSQMFWKKIQTVRRRNAFSMAAIADATMSMQEEATVKIAAGTPRLLYEPGDFDWIGQSRDAAVVGFGKQLAVEQFQDMLKALIASIIPALFVQATNTLDISGLTGGNELFSPTAALNGRYKLGDAASRIVCWVCNSKSLQDFQLKALTNSGALFNWGNVNVVQDSSGVPIVVTDLMPMIAGTPNKYSVLGLTAGGAVIEQNADFADDSGPISGKEQLQYWYQAQWSYNLGLKGFAWDKANGGASPTDAALTTSSNWDKVATDYKDLAGVIIRTQ